MTQRLPIPGQDDGVWGSVLNGFLGVSHNADGTLQDSAITNAGGYTKPSSGIPAADLDTSTQSIISSVASKYVKPQSGIPKSDLASSVQTSLTSADNALQSGSVAGGDLTGSTYPNPVIAKLNGISLPGVTPVANQVLTATSGTTTTWSTPAGGVVLDTTASDIQPLGAQSAGNSGKAADAKHVHPTTGLLLSANNLSELGSTATTARGNISAAASGANSDITSLSGLTTPLTIGQGGTGSATQNFVDLTTNNQTIAGTKIFSSTISGSISGNAATVTTNANLTGDVTSVGNATTLANTTNVQSVISTNTSFVSKGTLVFNVKDYGATGGGSANDATAINSALSVANTAGGGVVYLPAGTYIVGSSLTIYSNVSIEGAGYGATIIKLQASANTDVLVSNNFSSLTGTNSTGGVKQFTLSNFTIDGNKSNQSSAGYGARIYGYDFAIDNVHIRNCYIDGLYTEWGTTGNPPSPDSMEGHFTNLKIHDNGGNGFHHLGPHDSQVDNSIFYNNAGIGCWADANSTATGVGLLVTNSHSWGNSQTYSWQLDTQAQLANCVGEGAVNQQVLIRGNNCSLIGGLYFSSGSTASTCTGVQIGDGTHAASGTHINTQLLNFTAGAINFNNDAGNSVIRLACYQTSGTPIIGTPATSSRVEVHVGGQTAATNETLALNSWIGPTRIDSGTSGNAFRVRNSGTDYFNVNSGSQRVDFVNGTTIHMWSDNYTTTTGTWNASTGVLSILPATASTTGLSVTGQSSQSAALVTLQGVTSQTGAFLQALSSGTGNPAVFYVDSTGAITVVPAGASNIAYRTQISGNSTYSFAVHGDGQHLWGPGTSATDTNLYRGGVGIVKSDNRIWGNDGIQTKAVAGTPSDASFTNAPSDGTIAVDTATNTFWIRSSGTWTQIGAGSGTVTSVTAGDTSIVVGGTAAAPTIETATLDVIATDHPAAASWSNNNNAITNVSDLSVSGLTGAAAASRYVGATASGAPTTTSTTFAIGDFVIDQTGKVWICTAAGAPGTWSPLVPPIAQTMTTSYKSGGYVQGVANLSTSATLGNGSLRLCPFPIAKTTTISQIGAEFTAAGDASSILHVGIYNDDGTGYPGSLALDAGSISTGSGNAGTVSTGGTPGVYLITLGTPITLQPGLYWFGGAVQGVTTTQPTMRIATFGTQFSVASPSLPAAGAVASGYLQGSVTSALPSSFVTFSSSSNAGSIPRIIFKFQ